MTTFWEGEKMFDWEMILAVISAFAAAGSAIFAGAQLKESQKTQKEMLHREKQKDTLEAFNKLQSQVFDELNKYKKSDFAEIAKDTSSEKYKEIKVLVARCEHFAVGVYKGIYDIETVKELGGGYIYYLYNRVLPIIEKAQEFSRVGKIYSAFEKLHYELKPKKENMDNSDNT